MGLGRAGCRAGAGGTLDRANVEPPGLCEAFESRPASARGSASMSAGELRDAATATSVQPAYRSGSGGLGRKTVWMGGSSAPTRRIAVAPLSLSRRAASEAPADSAKSRADQPCTLRGLTLALALRRPSIVARSPPAAACINGVLPPRSARFTFAPACNSAPTVDPCFSRAASMSGVIPYWSALSTAAPE